MDSIKDAGVSNTLRIPADLAGLQGHLTIGLALVGYNALPDRNVPYQELDMHIFKRVSIGCLPIGGYRIGCKRY